MLLEAVAGIGDVIGLEALTGRKSTNRGGTLDALVIGFGRLHPQLGLALHPVIGDALGGAVGTVAAHHGIFIELIGLVARQRDETGRLASRRGRGREEVPVPAERLPGI